MLKAVLHDATNILCNLEWELAYALSPSGPSSFPRFLASHQ